MDSWNTKGDVAVDSAVEVVENEAGMAMVA